MATGTRLTPVLFYILLWFVLPRPVLLAQDSPGGRDLLITSHVDGQVIADRVLRLQGTLNLPTPVRMAVDIDYGDGSSERKLVKPGGDTFSVYIVLRPGRNHFAVKAIDSTGARHRKDISVIYNQPAATEPGKPASERKILIEYPSDDSTVSSSFVKVSGRVIGGTDGGSITLVLQGDSGEKSKQVQLREGGRFQSYFVLSDTSLSLKASYEELLETVRFSCTTPKGGKVKGPLSGSVPGGDTAPPAVTPSRTGGPGAVRDVKKHVVLSGLRIQRPSHDSILNTPVLRVKGTVHKKNIVSVKLILLSGDRELSKVVDVVEQSFQAYFVLRNPYLTLNALGFDKSGVQVADDVVEFRCSRPKGWTGALPWEKSEQSNEERPVMASGQRKTAAGAGEKNAAKHANRKKPVKKGAEKLSLELVIFLPLFLFVMLPVIVIRGRIIIRKLTRRFVEKNLRTVPVTCDFCKARAKQHLLFSLDMDGEGGDVARELVECASLTSNDEVNKRMKPLIEQAQVLAENVDPAKATPVYCSWCRECKSGFLIIGQGESRQRHAILTPVYFDWFLVTLGLQS